METKIFRLKNTRNIFNTIRLTLLYDSVSLIQGVQTGWGFACIIEVGETTLLFDTGSDGKILLENMERLGFDPKDIQLLVISHNRAGHIGGLEDFLQKNPSIPVYVPQSFPRNKIEDIEKVGAKVIGIYSAKEIRPNIFTLGEFIGYFREQAIALRTSKGTVVITGCAHQGIIPILRKAKEVLPNDSIYLILGGFHFSGLTIAEKLKVFEAFKMLSVKKVAPCHCCEEACRLKFKEIFGHNYIDMGVGGVIEIKVP